MSKKINEIIKQIPKNEKCCLHFKNEKQECFEVTQDKDNTYYLYQKLDEGYKYLKSRKKDPCFPECY